MLRWASRVRVSVITAAAPASIQRWREAPSLAQGPAATKMGFFRESPISWVDLDMILSFSQLVEQLVNSFAISAGTADLQLGLQNHLLGDTQAEFFIFNAIKQHTGGSMPRRAAGCSTQVSAGETMEHMENPWYRQGPFALEWPGQRPGRPLIRQRLARC